MFGGFQGNGHHGHGHHGHHHGHHHDHHNNHHGHHHDHHNHHHGHKDHHQNEGFSNQTQWGQQTSWTPIQGAHYKIVSGLSSHMVLDVSQNPHDYNHLIIYEWNGGANQQFTFHSIGGNKFGIFSAKTHQTVEVPNGSQHNGSRIVCSQPNKQVNEFWELVPANFMGKPNSFYLKSFCGKALDVQGGQCQNEAHVIQWDFNGGNNQVWVLEQC